MAARKTTNPEYYPHLLKDSTTIRALEMLYGNDGYAVWFKLLEVLVISPEYTYVINSDDDVEFLTDKFKVDKSKMEEILQTLAGLNAIDKDLWNKSRTLYVKNLIDNVQKTEKKPTTRSNIKSPVINEEKNIDKVKHGDYVYLLPEEYDKLVKKFGNESTIKKIENLDNYIGQKPSDKKRHYDSHYRTILVWANNDEKKQGLQKAPQYKELNKTNLFK